MNETELLDPIVIMRELRKELGEMTLKNNNTLQEMRMIQEKIGESVSCIQVNQADFLNAMVERLEDLEIQRKGLLTEQQNILFIRSRFARSDDSKIEEFKEWLDKKKVDVDVSAIKPTVESVERSVKYLDSSQKILYRIIGAFCLSFILMFLILLFK